MTVHAALCAIKVTNKEDGDLSFIEQMCHALDLPISATPEDCINRALKRSAALVMANATAKRRGDHLDQWISAATSNAQFGRVCNEVTPDRLREDIDKAVDAIQKRQAETFELEHQVRMLTLDLQNLKSRIRALNDHAKD